MAKRIPFIRGSFRRKQSERSALTKFLPTEERDYPIRSRRYIAFEKAAVSLFCKQDLIEPNHITYFRFFICLVLLLFFSRFTFLQILILAALGALSDFFDGALARSASKKTRLGIILDPLADKLLVFILIYILIMRGALDPIYLVLMILMEGHVLLIPVFSWFYSAQRGRNNSTYSRYAKKDRGAFALKTQALFIGKVKFLLYANALLGIFLGEILDSSFILKIAN